MNKTVVMVAILVLAYLVGVKYPAAGRAVLAKIGM